MFRTILREGNAPTSAFTSTLDNSCVFKQAEIVIHIHVVIAYMSGDGDTALKHTSSPPGHCRDDLSCGVWRLEQSMKEKQTCNIEA